MGSFERPDLDRLMSTMNQVAAVEGNDARPSLLRENSAQLGWCELVTSVGQWKRLQ